VPAFSQEHSVDLKASTFQIVEDSRIDRRNGLMMALRRLHNDPPHRPIDLAKGSTDEAVAYVHVTCMARPQYGRPHPAPSRG
jgi:hypothetical protein